MSEIAVGILRDDPSVGIVATYGWWKDKGSGYRVARGFTGVTSSEVIEKVFIKKQGKLCNDLTERNGEWHSKMCPKRYGFEREERAMNYGTSKRRLQYSAYPAT